MNRSTFEMIKYMNGSVFSKARYMNGVGIEILARTPIPQLPSPLAPPPPPPTHTHTHTHTPRFGPIGISNQCRPQIRRHIEVYTVCQSSRNFRQMSEKLLALSVFASKAVLLFDEKLENIRVLPHTPGSHAQSLP